MTDNVNLILALQQTENIIKLTKGNVYEGFLSSHLLLVKYELERQIALQTNGT